MRISSEWVARNSSDPFRGFPGKIPGNFRVFSVKLLLGFERRICAQTQNLQIFKKFNMSQMNPKEIFHNTAYSVQLPYIAGHSL